METDLKMCVLHLCKCLVTRLLCFNLPWIAKIEYTEPSSKNGRIINLTWNGRQLELAFYREQCPGDKFWRNKVSCHQPPFFYDSKCDTFELCARYTREKVSADIFFSSKTWRFNWYIPLVYTSYYYFYSRPFKPNNYQHRLKQDYQHTCNMQLPINK